MATNLQSCATGAIQASVTATKLTQLSRHDMLAVCVYLLASVYSLDAEETAAVDGWKPELDPKTGAAALASVLHYYTTMGLGADGIDETVSEGEGLRRLAQAAGFTRVDEDRLEYQLAYFLCPLLTA